MRRLTLLVTLFLLAIGPPVFATEFLGPLQQGQETTSRNVPKILKASEIRPGTAAVGFSVFRGVEPERFDVELRGITDKSGFDLILSRIFRGPMETPLEKIGAIQGMSGSPIFIGCANGPINDSALDDCIKNGTLVGALSYAAGYFILGGTNALLTPAEYMLGARLGGYSVIRQFSSRPDRINVEGVEFINLLLFPRTGSSVQGEGPGNDCGDSVKGGIKPGSMVSIFLAQGSVNIAASGTVTWIDGNRIYVFGHPFFGTGTVSYPFKHVSVVDTLQTPVQAHKITGCYLETGGEMRVDGMFEVAGIIGRTARTMPFQVELHAGENLAVLSEEVANSPITPAIIGQFPVFWAQQFLGDTSGVSVAYQARIPLSENPEIFLQNLIPAQAVENPLADVFSGIIKALERLKKSNFKYEPESIKVHVDLVKEMVFWKAKRSFLSQNTAKPGDTVHANIVFEESVSKALRQISIPIKVPGDFPDRIVTGVVPQISVIVQSASKFKDKSDPKSIVTIEDLIEDINKSANLKPNVLYIQQVMPLAKDKRETAESSAKSSTPPAWSWVELDQGSLLRLPNGVKEEITLNVSPALDHYIDFDATFNVSVQLDKDAAKQAGKKKTDESAEKTKNKKWFFLYLL